MYGLPAHLLVSNTSLQATGGNSESGISMFPGFSGAVIVRDSAIRSAQAFAIGGTGSFSVATSRVEGSVLYAGSGPLKCVHSVGALMQALDSTCH